MDKAAQKMSEQKKASVPNHNVPKKLRIGDSVKVISMNLKGTVHSLPNARGDLYVQMGILRSLVNINDLILLEEDAAPGTKKFQKTSAGKIKMSKSASVSTEINLIGKTTDEAIPLLTSIWTTLIWRICRPCASFTERHGRTPQRGAGSFKALKICQIIPPRRVR